MFVDILAFVLDTFHMILMFVVGISHHHLRKNVKVKEIFH